MIDEKIDGANKSIDELRKETKSLRDLIESYKKEAGNNSNNNGDSRVGKVYKLDKLYFEVDKSDVTPEGKAQLEDLIKLMKDRPTMEVEVGGHADYMASDAYNLRLSERRAKSVYDYIISKGIAEKRLSYKGYGKSVPVTSLKTPEGRQLNRRVELKVTKE
jgi:outer membrane protein OmpA-like peptidoglycan-associated protein